MDEDHSTTPQQSDLATLFAKKAKEGAIQGRAYLTVKWRVVWFRSEHPDYSISTELIQTQPFIIVRARIVAPDGREVATGYGSAPEYGAGRSTWKGRELEKAETAAIGRTLSLFGYGTEFTDDFDEGDHLADAPQDGPRAVDKPAQPKASNARVIANDFNAWCKTQQFDSDTVLKALKVSRLGEFDWLQENALQNAQTIVHAYYADNQLDKTG